MFSNQDESVAERNRPVATTMKGKADTLVFILCCVLLKL